MTAKDFIDIPADVQQIATAKFSINTATTTNFDFGTPNDISLEALVKAGTIKPGDRILAVFHATTAGTTDPISFSVQDAPDDGAGAIGTPATAVTDGTLTGGTGDRYAIASVKVQAGRPWLRFRATRTGTTDTHVATCSVYAVRRSGV